MQRDNSTDTRKYSDRTSTTLSMVPPSTSPDAPQRRQPKVKRVLIVNDVAFIIDTLGRMLSEEGIRYRVIGRASSAPSGARVSFVRQAVGIRRSIGSVGEFDLLHVNYGLFGFLALASEKPTVLHCHGSDIRPGTSPKTWIANLVTMVSFRNVDTVWYSTTDLSRFFEHVKKPHRYMPNPVASQFFSVPVRRGEGRRILFAVPLTLTKGADLAVQAMRLLAKRSPHLQISAFGYRADGAASDRLKDEIPRSIGLLPWISHLEMPHRMAEADVIVGRLRLGSLGITELEALASGRPLITFLPESRGAADGYYRREPPVVSCATPAEVADAVEKCSEDKSFASGIGSEGRRWALEYHSPSVVAKLYAREYKELIGW